MKGIYRGSVSSRLCWSLFPLGCSECWRKGSLQEHRLPTRTNHPHGTDAHPKMRPIRRQNHPSLLMFAKVPAWCASPSLTIDILPIVLAGFAYRAFLPLMLTFGKYVYHMLQPLLAMFVLTIYLQHFWQQPSACHIDSAVCLL